MMRCRLASPLCLLIFLGAASAPCFEAQCIAIPSPGMKISLMATVVIPDSYARGEKRFPVVYLLHGYNGDHTSWPNIIPVGKIADACQLILVCPSGENSWYLDSPVSKKMKFETYIAREMVSAIDSQYRTWPETAGRAIAGMSMGGHGALSLLALHPGVFLGAVSIAGIMDLSEFPEEWGISAVLGPYDRNRKRWREHSCIGLLTRLKHQKKVIIIDCGTEDFALSGNRRARALLTASGIACRYFERPGSHDWRYVAAVAEGHLSFLARHLLPARRQDDSLYVDKNRQPREDIAK